MKAQKGITLVALVITIIVLLILAMVSILIVNQQGLFDRAKNSATTYNKAAEDEQANITAAEKIIDNYANQIK